jgi:hypothetical protein
VPELPYAQELSEKLDALKANPDMAAKLEGVDMPDLTSMKTVKFDMNSQNSSFEMPQELIDQLKSSDVTTITNAIKLLSSTMFDLMTPDVITNIQSGIQSGITAMEDAASGMDQGITGMQSAVDAQTNAVSQLESMYDMMASMSAASGMPEGVGTTMPAEASMPAETSMPAASFSIVDMIPADVRASIPEEVLSELSNIKTAEELLAKIDEIKSTIDNLNVQIDSLTASKAEITDMIDKMKILKDAVPGAFTTAKNNYLSEIDQLQGPIEAEFQNTMNVGFKQLYLTVLITATLAFIILMFYKKKNETAEI